MSNSGGNPQFSDLNDTEIIEAVFHSRNRTMSFNCAEGLMWSQETKQREAHDRYHGALNREVLRRGLELPPYTLNLRRLLC